VSFERRFNDIEKLKHEQLFREDLYPDIREKPKTKRDCRVFPAVRNDRIDFYYKGGKLFSYDGKSGFTTHHKYASVIRFNDKNPYITDKNLQAISSFSDGYHRIKENCKHYSGVEAQGVSQIYGNFSCATTERQSNIVVLDIEISLRRDSEDKVPEPGIQSRAKSDRIDLLLFNTKTGLLRFFEAKDFSNSDIRAIPTRIPAIVNQMKRYAKQLKTENVLQQMISSYSKHVDVINKLFDPKKPIPKPQYLDTTPRLLVFGFDRAQLTGKLKSEINRLETDYELSVYAIGNIGDVKPDALFIGGKKRWKTII